MFYKDINTKLNEIFVVDGAWLTWEAWSQCSTSCGHGTRSRERSCTNPTHAGMPCSGTASESGSCKGNKTYCVIFGNFFAHFSLYQSRENGQIGCNGHNVQPLVAPEPEIEPEVILLDYLALEVTLIRKAVKVLTLL